MEPHRTDRATEHASEKSPVGPARSGGWTAGAVLGAVLLAAGACAESSIGGSLLEKSGRIDLSNQVPAAEGSSSVRTEAVRADVTIGDGPQIVVDSVDVVIRELQAGQEGTECAFRPQGVTTDADGSDCEEFGGGVTFVQSLPVDQEFSEIVTSVPIEPGTWDRLEFEFNVLEVGQPEDQAVLNDRTDLRGASVMIQGTFDGQEFEILLALDDRVDVPADPPLVIEEEGEGGVVLVWNVSQWFDDGEGGLVDPVAASEDDSEGQDLRDQIEANVLEALELETSAGG